MTFADRLADAVRARGTPVIVGLDPRVELLPASLQPSSREPATVAEAYRHFCNGVIDVVAPLVPAVKPQAAFFEAWGRDGVAALADVIAYARSKGLLVILDAKRGDVGSTAEAYAHGLLGGASSQRSDVRSQQSVGGSLASDAITVNPYLGGDTLEPFVEVAVNRACGVFVLVKTSNPGSAMFQDLVADGRPVYRHVAEHVEGLAGRTRGACGYGAVGAVVGATYPDQLAELRVSMPSAWLLVPGYGSQGGGAADVAAAFDEIGLGAIINNSRGIIFAHRHPEHAHLGETRWQDAVQAATQDMIAALRAETPAGRL
jgi:orotidine-5'-phosphate decarboxylase